MVHLIMLNVVLKKDMCIYDVKNQVPIKLTFEGNKNKNNEVNELTTILKKEKIKDALIICDRAYVKYEFFDVLDKLGLKYIIRIKDNCKIINPEYKPSKNDKNKDYVNSLKNNKNVKIIKYEINSTREIVSKNKKLKKIKIKTHFNLLTNLGEEKTDQEITDLYKSRWDIEVFFKILKSNFKFSYLNEKDVTNYKKNILC